MHIVREGGDCRVEIPLKEVGTADLSEILLATRVLYRTPRGEFAFDDQSSVTFEARIDPHDPSSATAWIVVR